MKKFLCLISMIALFHNCYAQQKGSSIPREDFYVFLEDFSRSKNFQIKRIDSHFSDCIISSGGDTTFLPVDLKKWHHEKLIADSYINALYDGFDLPKDSDRKVFAKQRIEGGGATLYYFKRIKGKWFLIKIVTFED